MKLGLPRRSVAAALLLCSALPRAATQTPAERAAAKTSAAETTAQPANIFDARAAALVNRFHSATSAAEQAALLIQIYDLRELVADRPAFARFFTVTATDAALPALVRDAAHGYSVGRPVPVAPELLAQATAAARSNDAGALETLAGLEHLAATGAPLEHMLIAARRHPTAERWLLVARWASSSSITDSQPQIFCALTAALALAPDSSDTRLALANYYAGRGQTRKALGYLQNAPADFRVQWRIAELLATLGRAPEAEAGFARVAREYPQPFWVRHQAAVHATETRHLDQAKALLTALLLEEPNDVEARAQLARVLELQRDTLALRQLAEGHPEILTAPSAEAEPNTAAGTSNDDSYLVDAPQLARSAQAQRDSLHEAAGAISLAEVRIERLSHNGLAARHVQEVVLLASDEAARDYATREIQYAPAAEELRIVHARVFKRDGRWRDAIEAGERSVADARVAMYYDARACIVRFRDLQAGDVIELDYRTTPLARTNPYGAGVYPGQVVAFQSALPHRLQRYVVIAPVERPLRVAAERMPPPQVTVAAGERRYLWEVRDTAALSREPRSPALTEVAPYVHVSSFTSWQDLGRWYAALLRPQLAGSDETHAALTQALHGVNHKDELAKIRAIHELVLKQTHYVALEFGIHGYQPYPVAQTFARRFGDCKDKATLMIALLREAGIAADFALVRTRRLGRISEQASSISVFDHAIVYVPKHDLWLDGTAEYSGSRELPLEDQGAMALTIPLNNVPLDAAQDAHATLRYIPATSPDDNYTRRTVRAEIRSDGTLQFSGSAYTRGEDAPGLRREYEIAERQRDSFRARLAEVLPAVQVEAVDVEGAHNLENDVTVNFRGTLDSFTGRKSLALASTWMPRSYLQTLAPLARRSQPLLLAAPWTTEEALRFALPRGAHVAFLPPPQNITTDFGSAQLTYEVRGGELRVHTRVSFRETRITPEQYGDFRRFCADIERAFREEVKVVLP